MVKTYFTTYEDELNRKLKLIEPHNFIDIKLTATPYNSDGQTAVEYGFLLIYKEIGGDFE
jgi:hypothetical protein